MGNTKKLFKQKLFYTGFAIKMVIRTFFVSIPEKP